MDFHGSRLVFHFFIIKLFSGPTIQSRALSAVGQLWPSNDDDVDDDDDDGIMVVTVIVMILIMIMVVKFCDYYLYESPTKNIVRNFRSRSTT